MECPMNLGLLTVNVAYSLERFQVLKTLDAKARHAAVVSDLNALGRLPNPKVKSLRLFEDRHGDGGQVVFYWPFSEDLARNVCPKIVATRKEDLQSRSIICIAYSIVDRTANAPPTRYGYCGQSIDLRGSTSFVPLATSGANPILIANVKPKPPAPAAQTQTSAQKPVTNVRAKPAAPIVRAQPGVQASKPANVAITSNVVRPGVRPRKDNDGESDRPLKRPRILRPPTVDPRWPFAVVMAGLEVTGMVVTGGDFPSKEIIESDDED